MSDDYTIVALRDLEDQAAAGGFGEVMQARFARQALGAQSIGISLQRIKPGQRGSFAHRHAQDEEVYVVVSGSGRALLDGELVELRPSSALRVAPATARAFEAGDEGLELIAFGTHTENDHEIVEAHWRD
jgi:uncharacterized cupin superfamily protein